MTKLAKLKQFIADAKTVKKNLRHKREEKSNEEKQASLNYRRRFLSTNFTQRYETLTILKFIRRSKHELEKECRLNSSSLNMKLNKFKGYNSSVHI